MKIDQIKVLIRTIAMIQFPDIDKDYWTMDTTEWNDSSFAVRYYHSIPGTHRRVSIQATALDDKRKFEIVAYSVLQDEIINVEKRKELTGLDFNEGSVDIRTAKNVSKWGRVHFRCHIR